MTFARSIAFSLLAAAAIVPAAAFAQAAQPAAQAAPQIKLSAKAGKAIIALQTAINAKDTANIPALTAAAKAVASSPDDRYAIAQLELKAAAGANNNEAAAAAFEAMVASGFTMQPQQVSELAGTLGGAMLRDKKYDRAASLLEKAIAANPTNADYQMLLAETRVAQGKNAEALTLMQKALGTSGGTKAPENTYKRAFLLAYGAESPLTVQIGRQWLEAYPTPESWRNSLAVYRNMNKLDIEGTLDVLRLMRATNALSSADDYVLLSQAAAEKGNYAEAQAVLDEGIAAKKVNPSMPMVAETLTGLKGKKKPTAADLATASKDAKTGAAKLNVGNRFYGNGDYAAAADQYKAALAAGADAGLANLRLGMALARSGDKAGATAALKAVSGTYAPIAGYWLIYVAKMA
jgi:tetratricopeptide (TPR) repeat protein